MIKLNGEPIQFKHFNDGTLRLTLSSVDKCIYRITWLYENDEELTQIYFLTQHLRKAWKIAGITLEMPYVPNARMDRVKDKNECFTLKYFCDFINSLNFTKVIIFDPHSRVAAALLDNVEVYDATISITNVITKHSTATLCFPDSGAMQRYSKLFSDIYFAFGVKDREWSSQEVKSLKIMGAKHMIAGHDVILCDDIISRGSTIYLAAKQLKEMGAEKIYVYCSHCEKTIMEPHLNGQSLLEIPNLIEKVYTTNSIWKYKHPKVEVIFTF